MVRRNNNFNLALVATVFAIHSGGYVSASDYGYTGAWQSQPRTGQQNDYSARWSRDTKPWSRDPSWVDQSGFDSTQAGYAGDHNNQWEGESSGARNWRNAQAPYSGESWPSSAAGWDPPRQHTETGRMPSGEQPGAWKNSKDGQGFGGWGDSPSASKRWGDRQPDSGSWSHNNGSEKNYNTYDGASRYGRLPSTGSGLPRNYSGGGVPSSTQDAWGKGPWPENSRGNSQRDSRTYTSGADPYWDRAKEGRGWGPYEKSGPQEQSPWGVHRQTDAQPPKQQPKSSTYGSALPDIRQSEFPSSAYPEYSEPYPGMWESGMGYGPVPGYGRGIHDPGYTYRSGASYPGGWNVPTIGDLLWFPF